MLTVKDLFENEELMKNIVEDIDDVPEDTEVSYAVWALCYDEDGDCVSSFLTEEFADPDAAISAYQTAYVLTPEDIDIYVNLGSAFYDKEDYNNALAVYRQALELQPHNPKIHCNLGFLYWGKADTEEAIKSYELAIKYNKNYDIAYNNLGVIYLDDLGRVNKAI